MREIDIKKNREASLAEKRISVLCYGGSGTGKTRFAATFPRPLFLSPKIESGWTTIETMNEKDFYEPGVLPRVWEIENAVDMIEGVNAIKAGIVAKPGSIKTVVVDSLTFYSSVFHGVLEAGAAGNVKEQGFAVYRKLGVHLNAIMDQLHALPVSIVWLCLAKEPGEGNTTGQVMLTGQTAQMAPARCDYFMYLRSFSDQPGSPKKYALHPNGYGIWPGRCRDGGLLPEQIDDVSFRGIMNALEEGKKAKLEAAKAEAEPKKDTTPPTEAKK